MRSFWRLLGFWMKRRECEVLMLLFVLLLLVWIFDSVLLVSEIHDCVCRRYNQRTEWSF